VRLGPAEEGGLAVTFPDFGVGVTQRPADTACSIKAKFFHVRLDPFRAQGSIAAAAPICGHHRGRRA
jgi:hypothetical protein